MSTATVKTLGNEAIKSLNSYLKTGIEGFKVKGLDRCKALNINVTGFTTKEHIEHLVSHLLLNGYGA